MRSILVNADRKPGNDARIDTALDLARQFGAHVSVLVDTPVTRYIAMDPMGGSYVISDALEEARGEDDAAASDIETRMARDDVPFDVLRSEDDPVSALANAARLSDLVIVSRSGGLAGELALVSRAPVLALPDSTPLQMPIRRACIAWDGGEQSAAALRASVPLLQSCQMVKVISVIEKPGGFATPLPVWSLPDHSPLHAVTLATLESHGLSPRALHTCNNVRTLIEIVANGTGAAVLPETMIREHLSTGTLREVLPRPRQSVHFEAAIRTRERDPVILDLFARAAGLEIDGPGD